MNSTCIRTVFKMKSWNFTGTSTTLRDRSWRGWRFYRSPIGVRNKGLITQNTQIRRASHSFQDEELKLHRNVDDSPWQVVEGLTFLPFPIGVRNKGLITQNTQIRRASHSFQDEELKLHRNVDDSSRRTGRGRVDLSTVPLEGSEIMG